MHKQEQLYNVATIRKLLLDAFTAQELPRFCKDHPPFRPIVDTFGPGHGLDDMVAEVMDYCETNLLLPELLAAVAQKNPRQYARYASRLWLVPPSPPTQMAPDPEGLSTETGARKAGTAAGQTVSIQTGNVADGGTVIGAAQISHTYISHGSPAGERRTAESPPEEGEREGGDHDAG